MAQSGTLFGTKKYKAKLPSNNWNKLFILHFMHLTHKLHINADSEHTYLGAPGHASTELASIVMRYEGSFSQFRTLTLELLFLMDIFVCCYSFIIMLSIFIKNKKNNADPFIIITHFFFSTCVTDYKQISQHIQSFLYIWL